MQNLSNFSSYAEIVRDFRWDIPERYNIADRILNGRQDDEGRVAIVDDKAQTWSYARLARRTSQVAAYLRVTGVQRGDRVGVSMPQSPETAAVHLAAYSIGAIVVPMSLLYGEATYRHIISDSGAGLVFAAPGPAERITTQRHALSELETLVVFGEAPMVADASYAEVIDAQPAGVVSSVDTAAADPAMLLYTSGTTGPPKGALHSHSILEGYLLTVLLFYNIDLGESPVFWTPSDWAWVGGLLDVVLPALAWGHPVVASSERFDAEAAFELLERNDVTHVFVAPTALKLMAQVANPTNEYSLKLQVLASGGEAVAAELHHWAQSQLGGVIINEFYGLTEVNHLAGSCVRLWPTKPGSMGPPYPGRTVAVLDENGEPVQPGEVGEIKVRPGDPTQMLGYWNNDEATAARITAGWISTGDRAYTDEDGYIYFQGRDDDLISSAGYRIGPAEIEEALLTHEAVADVAVIGKPDETRGAIVKAVIELAETYEPSPALIKELQDLVRATVGAYKYPREIEFVTELPKTVTGKLDRRQLTERERKVEE